MEACLVKKNAMKLAGMHFYGNPFENRDPWSEHNEVGHLWQRFFAWQSRNPEVLSNGTDKNTAYEIWISDKETAAKGIFEIFVGVELSDFLLLPPELSIKTLPVSKYARFTLKGEMITADWHHQLAADWLPRAGLKQTGNYTIQLYDKRFKGMDRLKDSAMDILIPVL